MLADMPWYDYESDKKGSAKTKEVNLDSEEDLVNYFKRLKDEQR